MFTSRTVHIRVEGRVQGVGYRAWMAAAARDLRLRGWVRNRRDGSVEAVLHGTPDAVSELLKRCAEGPLDAKVTRIEILGEGGGTFDGFEVRSTV